MEAQKDLKTTKHETGSKSQHELSDLDKVSLNFLQLMSILPGEQLKIAIQRGFQFWPTQIQTGAQDFLIPSLQKIIDEIRIVVGAEMAALGVVRSSEQSFSPWVTSGTPPQMMNKIGRAPRPVGTLGLAALHGQTVRVADVHKHPEFKGLPENHPKIHSLLAIPITYNGQPLGNIYLANKTGESQGFTEADQHKAEILSQYAALALQNAYFISMFELQQAQLHSVVDSAPIGMIFIYKQAGSAFANPLALELFNIDWQAPDAVSRFEEQLLPLPGQTLAPDEFPHRKAMRLSKTFIQEMLIYRSDGRHIPVIVRAAPVIGLQLKVLGSILAIENISVSKELERTRKDFAAMIVHDLRNPVQAALTSIQLIRRKFKSDQSKVEVPDQMLSIAEHGVDRLTRLINELAEVSRLDSGQVELNAVETDIGSLTKMIIDRFQSAYQEWSLRFDDHNLKSLVLLDQHLYERVLSNLVENAIKYSEKTKPIEISLKDAPTTVELSVRDHGIGIAPDEVPFVFERYYRGKNAKQKAGGVGLGLSIVKMIAEAHKATVSVQSEVGRGSVFIINFPKIKSKADK